MGGSRAWAAAAGRLGLVGLAVVAGCSFDPSGYGMPSGMVGEHETTTSGGSTTSTGSGTQGAPSGDGSGDGSGSGSASDGGPPDDDTQGCSDPAAIYDAFDGFSFEVNPTSDGRWQYGATQGLGGPFTLFTEAITDNGLQAWRHPGITDPNVVKNPTGRLIEHPTAPIVFPAQDYLHVHPGPSDEPSLVRWTAPTGGTYRVDAEFISLNTGGATTGVHIRHGDAALLDGEIMRPTDVVAYDELHELAAGDVLDFIVSDGGNGYTSDSTGVRATLTLMCSAAGPSIPPRR